MFCHSCGTSNPDDAKFCNECGVRLAPPTLQGDGAPRPAGGASAQGVGSAQGRASLTGLSTHDMAAAMVTGPSKRTLVGAGAGIAVLGIALGAAVAYKAAKPADVPPVTPVGLIGEPVSVSAPQTEETDAGTVVPVAPSPRTTHGTRVANRAPAPPPTNAASPPPTRTTPTPARPTTEPAPAPSPTPAGARDERLPSGNTIRHNANGTTTVLGADGRPLVEVTGGNNNNPTANNNNPTATNSGTTASNTTPTAENGVIERGPRVSQNGYHLGDDTDATGTMEPTAFQYVYRHYQSQIAACWQSASRAAEVSGVMVVRVRIAEADGHVTRTRIVSDSTQNAGLQACVQNAIRGWRYPRPAGGDVEVDYPLRFGSTR